jgi:hypothetical protein
VQIRLAFNIITYFIELSTVFVIHLKNFRNLKINCGGVAKGSDIRMLNPKQGDAQGGFTDAEQFGTRGR